MRLFGLALVAVLSLACGGGLQPGEWKAERSRARTFSGLSVLEITCEKDFTIRMLVDVMNPPSNGDAVRVQVDDEPPFETNVNAGVDAFWMNSAEIPSRLTTAKTIRLTWREDLSKMPQDVEFDVSKGAVPIGDVIANCR